LKNQYSKQNFNHFLLAATLVLACFLGYVFHPFFDFGQFIFLILLVVNPILFGYISKRPIMSFLVGFLPLFLMILYRLPFVAVYPSQPIDDLIILMPGALLLGAGGFFAARTTDEKKPFNLAIGILFILIMIAFYLSVFMF